MKFITVKFECENGTIYPREYVFKTNLDIRAGYRYRITNEQRQQYTNPCHVTGVHSKNPTKIDTSLVRTIVIAELIGAPSIPDSGIKAVYFDEAKRTTAVRWEDGTLTKVHCGPDEQFDREKGLALCYMKKLGFDNRGCFNNVLKKYCHKEDK